MWKTAWLVVMVLSLVVSGAERPAAQTPASEPSVSSPGVGSISGVRTMDVRIAALIARAGEQSTTFRNLLDEIAATDGIVYVEAGRCGRLRACLALKVTVAGPNRILWIFIDPQRSDCNVMASIGHELWHAVEVLRVPSIRSDPALYFFRTGERDRNPPSSMETEAAYKAGRDVRSELREPCD
jgi:hypothetical protein